MAVSLLEEGGSQAFTLILRLASMATETSVPSANQGCQSFLEAQTVGKPTAGAETCPLSLSQVEDGTAQTFTCFTAHPRLQHQEAREWSHGLSDRQGSESLGHL